MFSKTKIKLLGAALRQGFSLLLAVICVFSLGAVMAGCGGDDLATDSSNSPANTTDTASNTNDASDTPAGSTGKATKLAEGDEAPDFSYTTTDGTSGKLSDLRGRVVFINFWASWCGPCMQEMPDINELAQAYPEVSILEVNVNDTQEDAMAFINEAGYDVNWIIDDGTISGLYPTAGIPYTLVLDEFGTILVIFEGSAPDMFTYFEAAVKTAGA